MAIEFGICWLKCCKLEKQRKKILIHKALSALEETWTASCCVQCQKRISTGEIRMENMSQSIAGSNISQDLFSYITFQVFLLRF